MSAFLPIRAKRINVCAEYGYSSRTFNKRPWVVVSTDYESCLFLVYRQPAPLPNRIARYRNHFTLFRNDRSVVVVRTETTLAHQDNDAVLLYDTIQPSPDEGERYRAILDRWTVSFDRIGYANKRPASFADYDLVCSGEWWFFDRGVVLDGVTRYDSECPCDSMLVYYELHPKYAIRADSLERRQRRSAVLDFPYPRWRQAMLASNGQAATAAATTAACRDPTRRYEEWDASPLRQETDRLAVGGEASPSGNADPFVVDTAEPDQQRRTSPTGAEERRSSSVPPTPPLYASSLPASFLPMVNGAARTVIRANDERRTPQVRYRAAVPSLYWFRTRQTELLRCDISYFMPMKFNC